MGDDASTGGTGGTNGKAKMSLAKIIAGVIFGCLLVQGGLAALATVHGVQDWSTVNMMAQNLHTLAVMLTGGLLALAKPADGGRSG